MRYDNEWWKIYLDLLRLCDTVLIVSQKESISYLKQNVYFTACHIDGSPLQYFLPNVKIDIRPFTVPAACHTASAYPSR